MDELTFTKQLALMINEENTEALAPWKQVPDKFKQGFQGWCDEVKQRDYSNQWEVGWSKHHLEYLRYVVDQRVTELQRIRDVDYKWKKAEPSTQKA